LPHFKDCNIRYKDCGLTQEIISDHRYSSIEGARHSLILVKY